jgi:hypothetical protein
LVIDHSLHGARQDGASISFPAAIEWLYTNFTATLQKEASRTRDSQQIQIALRLEEGPHMVST